MSVTGAVSDSVVRDPFGKTLGSTGSAPDVGFQSDWTDPSTGLVWMGARWYQPGTGTFVSRDTVAGGVGAYASMNRFTYGLNNPVLFNDPTGRVAAPVGCDNACHSEYLQRTGELYDADTSFNDRYQNGERDATTDIYNDADGNTVFVVQNDVGITISTTEVTLREGAGNVRNPQALAVTLEDGNTYVSEDFRDGSADPVSCARDVIRCQYSTSVTSNATPTTDPKRIKTPSKVKEAMNLIEGSCVSASYGAGLGATQQFCSMFEPNIGNMTTWSFGAGIVGGVALGTTHMWSNAKTYNDLAGGSVCFSVTAGLTVGACFSIADPRIWTINSGADPEQIRKIGISAFTKQIKQAVNDWKAGASFEGVVTLTVLTTPCTPPDSPKCHPPTGTTSTTTTPPAGPPTTKPPPQTAPPKWDGPYAG
jgi:RHS repeat-associated protein